jgi:hypothetical protein
MQDLMAQALDTAAVLLDMEAAAAAVPATAVLALTAAVLDAFKTFNYQPFVKRST